MFAVGVALPRVSDETDVPCNLTGLGKFSTPHPLALKLLLFHVLISRPYDVCPRATP